MTNDHDDELDANERAQLADIAALLADDSLWDAPGAATEEGVVALIASASQAVAARPSSQDRGRAARWRWLGSGLVAGAAVAAAAAAIIVVAARTEERRPDATVAMAGTELAPGVGGSVEVTAVQSGVKLYLRVPGLPRRDGGEFYEVWVKTCDGAQIVPAGTFHDLTDAIAWAGVDPASFPLLTVTREQAAGPKSADQGTSGEIVAKGAIATCPPS